MPEEAFIDRLLDLTASDESVYRTIARDIYQNGQILQRRKYRLLGYAYRTFLTGMVLTAIAVTVEMIWGRFI
ncbi:MAG TPA: Pycsar system effector family protein [Sphingobium sp.]|nr:Pycsar system effector family protein [Sphingobium sp.]